MECARGRSFTPFFLCHNYNYSYLLTPLSLGWKDIAIALLKFLGLNVIQLQIIMTHLIILHYHPLFDIVIIAAPYVLLSALNNRVAYFGGYSYQKRFKQGIVYGDV